MVDSSRRRYEQSRCHSSNNTLYTDLFSPDKWTRAVWKSLSWIKQLSPKPLFYLSPFSSVCSLRSQTPAPWLGAPTLLSDSYLNGSKLPLGLLFRKSLKRTLEQIHLICMSSSTKDTTKLLEYCSQHNRMSVCMCSFLLYNRIKSQIHKLTSF